MKRRALIQHLNQHGCQLFREGGKHSVYYNPENNKITTVPRHREIKEPLAKKICKDVAIPPP